MWPFATEEEAILDVLRLARAMTYKSSLAGLDYGGGKAVIIADSTTDKSEALFRAHGRFVDTMGGRFITTEDVGVVSQDVVHMRKETRYAAGLPESHGGLGGAEVITGFGIYQGARACMKALTGSDSLNGKTVAIQGFGKVAYNYARHLREDGARIIAADINESRIAEAVALGATIVAPEEIHAVRMRYLLPLRPGRRPKRRHHSPDQGANRSRGRQQPTQGAPPRRGSRRGRNPLCARLRHKRRRGNHRSL